MTSVICSKSDCKHCNHGYCQLDEILIIGGFYKDIPFCSDYEQEVRSDGLDAS